MRRTGRMRRRGSGVADRGSAAIEFIVLGVGLLVPLVYLASAAATVQAAAFASAQAAREAGRAFSSSATPAQGRQRAVAAARHACRRADDNAGRVSQGREQQVRV